MNVFLFGVFGPDSKKELESFKQIEGVDKEALKTYLGKNWGYCVSSPDFFFAPPYPVWKDENEDFGLVVHGNPVLRDYTLDSFLEKPTQILKSILDSSKSSKEIPLYFVNGGYVGCILEPSKKRFFLFNNFFGLLPLYYTKQQESLYFSTDLHLLCRHPSIDVEWNLSAVEEYLKFGRILSNDTVIKGIFTLAPSSMLSFDSATISVEYYNTFPNELKRYKPFKQATEDVMEKWKKAIGRIYSERFTSCLSLTGGCDSRLIFLEWPNRATLLTETAGSEKRSDFIKAKELLKRIGNQELHAKEDQCEDRNIEGIIEFLKGYDNPLIAPLFNYFHLKWKASRGAKIRLSGVTGELIGGENLYQSRKPIYILWETFLPLKYKKLDKNNHRRKIELFEKVFYSEYKENLKTLLKDQFIRDEFEDEKVIKLWDGFIGEVIHEEVYLERIRTTMLSQIGYGSIGIRGREDFELVLPYCDSELVTLISKLPPKYRELRRLEIALLKKYKDAPQVPLDTTHLNPQRPYYLHKLMRGPRFVFNIGMNRKVPLIQKGEAKKAVTFNDNKKRLFEFMLGVIRESELFDHKKIENYLRGMDVNKINWKLIKKEWKNVEILFNLTIAEKRFFYSIPQYKEWLNGFIQKQISE